MTTLHRTAALALLLLTVWAGIAASPATAAPGDAVAGEQPLFMWRAASGSATVTLVGSIHVGRQDFFPLAPPFEEAFAAAPVLAVEVDMGKPANVQKAGMLMMQKAMLPDDETLQGRLSPELWQALQKYAEEHGASLARYWKTNPAMVVMVLTLQAMQEQGFDPELGIDLHFLAEARDTDKEIVELETIEDQLNILLNVDDTIDDIMVRQFVEEMTDIQKYIDEMVGLWQAGDVEGLDRFLQEEMGDDPAMAAYYRGLFDERNVKMADKIDAMLRGDRDVFVVVGAGHFAGDRGVLQLLRDKGWDVVQAHAVLTAAPTTAD